MTQPDPKQQSIDPEAVTIKGIEAPAGRCPLGSFELLEEKRLGGRLSPIWSTIGRVLQHWTGSKIAEQDRPPLLGSVPWFGALHAAQTTPMDAIVEGARRCGPIFRFELMGETINVVCGPEAQRIVKDPEALKLDRTSIFESFVQMTDVPIFSAKGKQHELLRRLVRLGYARSTIAPFVSRMSETVQSIIEAWPDDLLLQPRMADLAIRTMGSVISPLPMPIDYAAIGSTGETAVMVTTKLQPKFVLRFPRIRRAKRHAAEVLDPLIAQHRDGATRDDPHPWMIDAFLAANAAGQTLDDTAIRGGVLYSLIAAYVYIGRQALFMWVEAARDPRALSALYKEVDTAFSSGPLTAETLRKMPTLRAMFVETNRRYPLLPGMPFDTTETVRVGDYLIGPNETILLSFVPDLFAEEHYTCPWNFDQSRVRPPRNEHRAANAYAPWGYPPRSCLAIGLSELVSMTMVANLLHKFDLQISHKSIPVQLKTAPLIGPANGQPARLRRRLPSERTVDPQVLYDERQYTDAFDDLQLPEMEQLSVKAGDVIYGHGDAAERFYIIIEGRVKVAENSALGEEWQINAYGPGQGFGESGLLKRTPRQAEATASEDSELLVIEREVFVDLVAKLDEDAMHLAQIIKNRFVANSLKRSLEFLVEGEVHEYGDVTLARFDHKAWIIRQGDLPDYAYIIISGAVQVFARKGSKEVPLATLSEGDLFGEIGILEDRPRLASVQAVEPTVVAKLPADGLRSMLSQSKSAASGMQLLMARRMMNTLDKLQE